jgi:hypothetical protein
MKYAVAFFVGAVLILPLLILAAFYEMHEAWKNDEIYMWE